MRPFHHINADSLEEASKALGNAGAKVIAGGTELLGTLKDDILPDYPSVVVNIKSIPGLDYIKEEDGFLKIGALTRLGDIAENPVVQTRYTALGQAAKSVATPHIRDMGTIGGNISQLPRCWYFRKPNNRFPCIRKGGGECYAILGENKFHSAFGGTKLGQSPCEQACPGGTDIPGYFEALRRGDPDEAARIIMEVNPMPAITARVCAHFCQTRCNRCATDESVLISGVERVNGDYIFENADKFYPPPARETGKSVAVVGSGPAGLSAAYYLRRAGNRVTVYDSKPKAGGMLRYAIPAYRLPKDIVRKFVKILENMGIEFRLGVKIGEDVEPDELERNYDSVCFATGAWKRPVIGLAGEELTVFGLDFLVEVNAWMRGKVGSNVLVTGGGNVAIDVAVTAKRLGARHVTLACLEPREKMPASDEEIARAVEEGIEIMPSWGLWRVAEEDGAVRGMELVHCISPWDETGAFNPQYDENVRTVVTADNILMAVGQKPDLSFLDEKYRVQLNRRGLIGVDEDTQMTSREGVFAAGDVTTGPATVIGSIASGHLAAAGIGHYLEVLPVSPCAKDAAYRPRPVTSDPEGILGTEALKLRELDASSRRLDREDSSTPTWDEVAAEARRCMNCGCYTVNTSDTATALVALGAGIVTTRRTLGAEEFFDVGVASATALERDEIITEIRIPAPPDGARSAFIKFAFRKAIDFPVTGCAVMVGAPEPRVCLGAVATKPIRAKKAEDMLSGKMIDAEVAEAAGEAAASGAAPFRDTRYKLQIIKTMVKRALLSTIDIDRD